MKTESGSATSWTLLRVFGGLLVVALSLPTRAEAQKGNNAVYKDPSNCCQASPAFIDASVFAQTGSNICKILNRILDPTNSILPSTGGVIDARGLPFAMPSTSMTCTTANPSPWAGIANPPPSTILLPATGGTTPNPIIIPSTWILPPNTRLIGEGGSIGSAAGTTGTTIQAASTFTSGTMIQMGTSLSFCFPPGSSICKGISVENIVLDGKGQSINGIENLAAEENSYVDNVGLLQVRGTGLQIAFALRRRT
jgi:hypothetical protein